jgi:hypothetical protein
MPHQEASAFPEQIKTPAERPICAKKSFSVSLVVVVFGATCGEYDILAFATDSIDTCAQAPNANQTLRKSHAKKILMRMPRILAPDVIHASKHLCRT